MTEWVPSSWDAVKAGDTVRLEHGDGTTLDGTVQLIVAGIPAQELLGVATSVGWKRCIGWAGLGWSVFTPAPTTPALPTEPGHYLDNGRDYWRLDARGYWYTTSLPGDTVSPRDRQTVDCYAPFTRLEPVATTAKAVLDAVHAGIRDSHSKVEDGDGWRIWRNIDYIIRQTVAKQFGVEP